jgi:hypothetical protein
MFHSRLTTTTAMPPPTFRLLAFFALVVGATAAEPALPLPEMSPAVRRESGRLSFELLPKAFQKNPQLEMTVVSELTPYGRTLPPASPARPVYYLGVNSGLLERGDGVAGDHPPDANYLGRLLATALRTNGFLPATNLHHATQVLFFHWGTHYAMDFDMRALFPEKAYRELLERAGLVGGTSFKQSLVRQISYGETIVDPSAKRDFLASQASSNLYFIIVSAYDYAALAHKDRRLIWRANLTVAAAGVSMTDSLPALVLTGGPYFGRDLPESEILFRRVQRGVVGLGPARVIENDVPLPAGK